MKAALDLDLTSAAATNIQQQGTDADFDTVDAGFVETSSRSLVCLDELHFVLLTIRRNRTWLADAGAAQAWPFASLIGSISFVSVIELSTFIFWISNPPAEPSLKFLQAYMGVFGTIQVVVLIGVLYCFASISRAYEECTKSRDVARLRGTDAYRPQTRVANAAARLDARRRQLSNPGYLDQFLARLPLRLFRSRCRRVSD